MFGRELKEKREQIAGLKDVQAQYIEATETSDDYLVGLYNGLELCAAIMENRKPELMAVPHEPEVIEAEEEKPLGRTIASGVRIRNKQEGNSECQQSNLSEC